MLDRADQENARAQALRDADYASLTRRAATDNSRALVDEVLHRITATEAETRKRKRGSRAGAFRQVVEGFLGDLLVARGEGRVCLPTGRNNFTSRDITYRHFVAAKDGLKTLALLEEIPGKQNGPASRFSATPQLRSLAVKHGIQLGEADKHFVLPLPKHPLRLMGASTWARGNKLKGEAMEIDYTEKVTALERTIIDLNDFLCGFDIGGGKKTGQNLRLHPIAQVREAVRKAYPLLGDLRRDNAQPPTWANGPEQCGEVVEACGNVRVIRVQPAFPDAQCFCQCATRECKVAGLQRYLTLPVQVCGSNKRFGGRHQISRLTKIIDRSSELQLG